MRKSRLFVLFLLLLGLIGSLSGGPPFYSRLFYFSLSLVLLSALWTFFSIRGLAVEREARATRHRLGEAFEERFDLIHHGRIPCAWVEICDDSPLPGSSGSRVMTLVRGGQRRSYLARTWLVQRGHFPLGPTRVRSGDPFGLFIAEKRFPARQSVTVLPMIIPISAPPLPSGLLSGGRVIQRKALDATPHAATVRQYAPGDPLKRIHWPATARHGVLMVKEFEQDPQTQVWFFLDAAADEHYAEAAPLQVVPVSDWWIGRKPRLTLPRSTFEYAVTLTASLAHALLRQRLAIGLVTAAPLPLVLTAERGWRQELRLLEALAYLLPQGRHTLPELVTAQAEHLSQGSTAILITASRDGIYLGTAIAELLRRRLQVVLLWIDRASFEGKEQPSVVESLVGTTIPIHVIRYGEALQHSVETLFKQVEENLWQRQASSPWT